MAKNGKMAPNQSIFVDEYLKDRNGTRAAIAAGYSPKTANEQAAQLLAKVSIREEIESRLKASANDAAVTREKVLRELAKGAFHEVPLEDMRHSDKAKYMEMLCKILGYLDGNNGDQDDHAAAKKRANEILAGYIKRKG